MGTLSLLTRRQALLGGLGLCCCRVRAVGDAGSARALAADRDRAFATDEVAPGIHVRRGVDEDATPENQNAIANVGFIVGHESVAIIDPGGSVADGERLRATVRHVTNLPVRYVVMSHGHPDHIFGAAAFQRERPQFVGHERLPRALAARGEYYRKRLEEVLGKGAAGSVVVPTVLVRDQAQIELGGRTVVLTAHETAHTDCDLSVLDRQTQTLLAADLLFVRRVPSLDGSLTGWLKVLASLEAVPARRAVPGHGPTSVDWPGGARDLKRYLNVLLRETRQAIAKGLDINEAVRTVAQSERAAWTLFEDYNGHNITQAFKELEWE